MAAYDRFNCNSFVDSHAQHDHVISNYSYYNKVGYKGSAVYQYCLFDLILYVPVNNISIMSERVFLD